MGDIIVWFPKGKKEHIREFKNWWFGPYIIQYCFPNNIVLLIDSDKFEPNPILVNINKLKPIKYLGKVPKGLEATIEGGREHKVNLEHEGLKNKEASQKSF